MNNKTAHCPIIKEAQALSHAFDQLIDGCNTTAVLWAIAHVIAKIVYRNSHIELSQVCDNIFYTSLEHLNTMHNVVKGKS